MKDSPRIVGRFEPVEFVRWILRTCDWLVGVLGGGFESVMDGFTHAIDASRVPFARRIESDAPAVPCSHVFSGWLTHRLCCSGPVEKKLPSRHLWTCVSRSRHFAMDRRGQGAPGGTTRTARLRSMGCVPVDGGSLHCWVTSGCGFQSKQATCDWSGGGVHIRLF